MASYHKWDVKNGFTFVLQFFSLISDALGGVDSTLTKTLIIIEALIKNFVEPFVLPIVPWVF